MKNDKYTTAELITKVESLQRQALRTFETTRDEFTRIQAHAAKDAYGRVLEILNRPLTYQDK
jgi:hypothetical protein